MISDTVVHASRNDVFYLAGRCGGRLEHGPLGPHGEGREAVRQGLY